MTAGKELKGPIRPIHWDRPLRADEAEREIKRRLAIADPIMSDHVFDRIDERGDERLTDHDVLVILKKGMVRKPAEKEGDGWSVTVERRMPGTRDAGVVVVIMHPGDGLFVKTAEWMDWFIR